MNVFFRMTALCALCVGVAVFIGCSDSSDADGGGETASAIPASLFVDSEPAGALKIADAKQSAEVGDSIVITGRVGAYRVKQPFLDGTAIFYLADHELVPCNERPGDKCKFPWDYCCEDGDKMMAGTATIQIVDGEGEIIGASARNVHGMLELVPMTIVGTVAKTDKNATFVVNAEKIFVGEIETAEG